MLAEVTQNALDASVDLWCPELALAQVVFVQCGAMAVDPGEHGEGETMACVALDAMEGLGRLIAERAKEARRHFRVDVNEGKDGWEGEPQYHVRQVAIAAAQLVDLCDLYRVTMGHDPPRVAS